MPVIRLSCLPKMEQPQLRELHRRIVAAVVGVHELRLNSERDMTVLFAPDMMNYGLGAEVIVEIFGLLKKPERTKAVRDRLSAELGTTIKDFVPRAKVECFISPLNPRVDSFWSSATHPKRYRPRKGKRRAVKRRKRPDQYVPSRKPGIPIP